MAANIGSLKHSFAERSKERLLSRKNYSELGFGRSNSADDEGSRFVCFSSLQEKFTEYKNDLQDGIIKAYEMGRSDPRKVIFAAKMGLALSFVSILIFFKEPLSYISKNSIWAILTVVVVFEFSIGIIQFMFNCSSLLLSFITTLVDLFVFWVLFKYIGATLNKGFNRALGTFLAGGLSLGIAELSKLAGELQEVVIVISIFIAGLICGKNK